MIRILSVNIDSLTQKVKLVYHTIK